MLTLAHLYLLCKSIISRDINLSGTEAGISDACVAKSSAAYFSALPISRSHFYKNNSRKMRIAHPLGRDMGVFREFNVWLKFQLQRYCAVRNIMLRYNTLYRESVESAV